MGEGFDQLDDTELYGDDESPAQAFRFCGVSEAFGDGTAQVKLPSNVITFRVDDDLPGFTRSELEDVCLEAWKRWERVIGIRVDKHANPKTTPTQIVTTTRMDGPSGVLADQQLPYGNGMGLRMRIDTGERYVAADNPPQGKINLIAVLCHENGHCLGFQHIEAGSTPDLLNPTYSPRIFVPQPDDISYGRKLYGGPVVDEPLPPPPGGELSIVATWEVEINGVRYQAKGKPKRVA